ncbi:MAG: c-type cytochrome domain-containing protein [Planctomycetota bacterium]
MRKQGQLRTYVVTCFLACACAAHPASIHRVAAQPVDYARDILPILETYCIGCHTADDAQGGLVMEEHKALLAGGETGLAITPGVHASSRLWLMAAGKMQPVMPPDGMEGLNANELETLAKWIDEGAEGPAGGVPVRRKLRVPAIRSNLNARQPVTAVAVSPDGVWQATARFASITLERRDGRAGVTKRIDDLPGKVNSLRFSTDGTRLLAASGVTGAFGLAIVVDLASEHAETPLLKLEAHRDTLYAAEFSPNESLIATAGYDSDIVLWDTNTGLAIRKLTGHNGAIFDLAFSPDGTLLASASADETVKVWHVESGQRLDTMSQSEGEVHAVAFTPDGDQIVAVGADNRLRVWQLRSRQEQRINPVLATRYLDTEALTDLAFVPHSEHVVVLSRSGKLPVLRQSDWASIGELPPLMETGNDLHAVSDGDQVWVSLMNGNVVKRELTGLRSSRGDSINTASKRVVPKYLDMESLSELEEKSLREAHTRSERPRIPRGAVVSGSLRSYADADVYEWAARAGEVWAIDVDAAKDSMLDPMVSVVGSDGNPVLRTRLQAVRDSYFTFRGKNSAQSNDFRLFAWEEMNLNDFLYANGEVTRLWLYPRGPDSGFNVYPGRGDRFTFFGTSHVTHALGEPAFVVRELQPGEQAASNGLPVFEIPYQNDDDPQRRDGKNSRLLFTAPFDSNFGIRVEDTRQEVAEAQTASRNLGYKLTLRPAQPDFRVRVSQVKKPVPLGGGREFEITIDRVDDLNSPVTIDADQIPEGLITNLPLTIEPGQRFAQGILWTDADEATPLDPRLMSAGVTLSLTARADAAGRTLERTVGELGPIKVGPRTKATPVILPSDPSGVESVLADPERRWTLQVQRGHTVTARVRVEREAEFDGEVRFGKEFSGRNMQHGVYVDNIGLNGLLVLAGANEREFFITADPEASPGKRLVFLKSELDGGVTSQAIELEVLP